MNRGRVQDQTIPTGGNELDRTNMPLSEYLTREGILHNYELAPSLQDPSNYMISLILKTIGRILMNNPNTLLKIKS